MIILVHYVRIISMFVKHFFFHPIYDCYVLASLRLLIVLLLVMLLLFELLILIIEVHLPISIVVFISY